MIANLNILGIDKQDTLDVSRDGSCSSLRGMIPSGSTDRPQWRVNWMGEKLAVNIWSAGDQFLEAHISQGILFLWVKVTGNNHELWKVTKNTATYDVKTKLLSLSGAGSDIWDCQFAENKQGFWVTIIPTTSGARAKMYHYIHDAGESGLLLPSTLPNLGNNYEITANERSATTANFDRDYGFYGDVPGFLKNKDKHFAFRFALRLKNGQHARHSQPVIKSITANVSDTDTYWTDFTANRYTHFNYFEIANASGDFTVGETISYSITIPAKGGGTTVLNPSATVLSASKKYIIIEETGVGYDNWAREGVEITGATSMSTADIVGTTQRTYHDMLYNSHSQSYFDQIFDGLYVDPDNAILFDSSLSTTNLQPVPVAMKEMIDGVDVFMTLPHTSEEEAIDDGVFYYVGTLKEDGEEVNVKFNEETLATREVLLPDPFSHHWIAGHSVTNFRERPLIGGVYNNFGVPLLNYIKDDSAFAKTVTILAWVTIEKNNKKYYIGGNMSNFASTDSNANAETLTFPKYLSYPDRDAVKVDLWWNNGGNYELCHTVQFKKHPSLNLAYSYHTTALTYDEGNGVSTATPSANYSVDDYYEQNEYKVGDLLSGYWPLTQSYKIDSQDIIRGVISNVDELSQGQFGFHPFYILCDKAIYAARQGNNVLVQSTDKIDQEHGIDNRKCFTVKSSYLWGAGNGRIWVLRGSSVEEIQWPLLLNGVNTDLLPIEAVGRMFTQEAVIFAGAKENFVYDLRYKTWYSYKPKGINHTSATGDIAGRNFFEYNGNTYELANLIPDDVSQSDDAIINLDSQTKSTDNVSILIRTNPVKLTDSTQYKRLRSSIIKGKWVIPANESLSVKAIGSRSTHDSDIDLMTYTEGDTSEVTLNNLVVRGYGSFQGFIFEISGTIAGNSDTYLEHILIDYMTKSYRLKI